MNLIPWTFLVCTVGYLVYKHRNKLSTVYYNLKSNSFNDTVASLLVTDRPSKFGDMEVITFVRNGHIYHFPMKSSFDPTLSIGCKLYLVTENSKLDITPPAGYTMKISSSDFGDEVKILIDSGPGEQYFLNGQLEWPLEKETVIEE